MTNSATNATSLTVGSSEEADIVINQATVSRLHCRFQWNGKAWMLQDLDSTNGTFINGKRVTEPTAVGSNDKVTLGRGVACAIPMPPSAQPKTPMAAKEAGDGSKVKLISLAVAGAMLAILLIVGIVALFSSSPAKNDPDSASMSPTDLSSKTEDSRKKEENSLSESAVAKPAAFDPQSALWATVVESSDGKKRKLLGTAIAVQQNKFITLASLVDAAEAVKQEFPQLKLINTLNPSISIVPSTMRRHPNYTRAMEAFTSMEADLAEKLKTLNSLEEPSLEDKLKWSERYESIMEAISNADLAILESPSQLAATIQVAEAPSSEDCSLIGFPLILPSPEVNENIKAFSMQVIGKASSPSDLTSRNLQIETIGLTVASTVSLACLNAKNELLGIVSRQATTEGNVLKRSSKVIPIKLF